MLLFGDGLIACIPKQPQNLNKKGGRFEKNPAGRLD